MNDVLQRPSGVRLVALVCAAQVLVQLGAYFWPALLPGMMPLWGLSNSEAGRILNRDHTTVMHSVEQYEKLVIERSALDGDV